MRFFKLSWKNLFRRKTRTALTLAGVAASAAVLVSLLGFNNGYKNALEEDVDRLGYQMLVTAKGCPYEAATMMLSGNAELRYMDEGTAQKVMDDPRVDKSMPQLIHASYDPEREATGIYMGVTDAYRELKPWMEFNAGEWLTPGADDEVVLGYEAAELDQRSPGDYILVHGTDEALKVVGVFERSGSQDDAIAFVRMETLQRIFPRLENKLTGVGVKLKELDAMSAFETDLYEIPDIQVVSMARVKQTIMGLVKSARILVMSVAAIALIVAAVGVINTILMSVFERTQEIGIMKAMGASKADIFRLIWSETTLICAAGGFIGCAFARAAAEIVESLVRNALSYAPNGPIISITVGLMAACAVGAVALGMAAGLYPAARAASMRPIEAIRKGT